MVDSILTEIGNLKWIIVIYSTIIILLCSLLWFFTRKYSFDKGKTVLFAILYDLNYWQVFSFGLILGRLVFILCFAIFCQSIHLGHLIVLVLFCVGICITTKDYRSLPNELINSIAVYAMLFIQSALFGYYNDVEHLWAVLAMSILLGIFAFLYMALQSLSSYERFVTKKVIKKNVKKNKDTKLFFKLKAKND